MRYDASVLIGREENAPPGTRSHQPQIVEDLRVLVAGCNGPLADELSKCAQGLTTGFIHLDHQWMLLRHAVVAAADYLPGHFEAGISPANSETIPRNLRANVYGRKTSNASELVAEIAIERLEPIR